MIDKVKYKNKIYLTKMIIQIYLQKKKKINGQTTLNLVKMGKTKKILK